MYIMTRKCALCKETNYKRNNYSFFSAPKNAETRKKWQIALAIKNYIVTDDTYVCSKHFHKNDIITHWVSGVPPQVIKIKYKKCRLRPGAVPSRSFQSVTNSQSVDKDALNRCKMDVKRILTSKNKQALAKNETFSRKEKIRNYNEDVENENINTCYHTSKSQDYVYNYEENEEFCNIQLSRDMNKKDINKHNSKLENSEFERKILVKTFEKDNDNNPSLEFTDTIKSDNIDEEKNQIYNKSFRAKTFKTVEYNIKKHDSAEKNETIVENWEHDMQNEGAYDEINENELLFEDFLEICTEISMPRGWSCLVTSKGYDTTVVYLYMSITKNGLPFVEKQIFIRSDMMLHYVAANREIDPLMHNLVKDKKHSKLKNLLDIEIFIDEFNQRVICQGIYNTRNYEGVDITRKDAYMDGIKWRHISCPLIINNDSSRCTKCVTLSHIPLLHRS